jgi:hypothetical protein
MDEIRTIIDRIVRSQLADGNIQEVSVVEDADYQDQKVFRVTVVFDLKGSLDPKKTSGLVRHIRHELLDRDENTFPILTFVSKADAARIKTAAA